MTGLPLTGLRVVDLSSMFMGPYCTLLLAEWGSSVIKVEPPAGDIVRYIGDAHQSGMGPIFLNANRGKRSIAIDLKQLPGQRVLLQLIRSADVVVHNFRTAAEASLGLEASRVLELNPTIIHCAFRGFGSGGPYANRPAYDDIIQAASGVASVQGDGTVPEFVKTVLADKTVGLMGLSAILAGLVERSGTGRGKAVEIPMFETMAHFLLMEQQGGWIWDPPKGHPGYARTASPHRRPYRTRDGYLAVMAYTDVHWRNLLDLMGRSDLVDDPRYSTMANRSERIGELYQLVGEEMVKGSTKQWLDGLTARDIPASRVNSLSDLFLDPHLDAVDFFQCVKSPTEGLLRHPRVPVRMGARVGQIASAPTLGEHSVEIAREIGVTDRDVEAMLKSGVMIMPDDAHD